MSQQTVICQSIGGNSSASFRRLSPEESPARQAINKKEIFPAAPTETHLKPGEDGVTRMRHASRQRSKLFARGTRNSIRSVLDIVTAVVNFCTKARLQLCNGAPHVQSMSLAAAVMEYSQLMFAEIHNRLIADFRTIAKRFGLPGTSTNNRTRWTFMRRGMQTLRNIANRCGINHDRLFHQEASQHRSRSFLEPLLKEGINFFF
jgi:hypothetical protein